MQKAQSLQAAASQRTCIPSTSVCSTYTIRKTGMFGPAHGCTLHTREIHTPSRYLLARPSKTCLKLPRMHCQPEVKSANTVTEQPPTQPAFGLQLLAHGLYVLVGLALIDAAYSGDWSGIGAISKDTELLLQKFVWIAAGGHAVCAVGAAALAQQRGADWTMPAAKALVFGAWALKEEMDLQ